MKSLLLKGLVSVSLLSGCTAAYADRIAAPPPRPLVPIAVAPEAVRSPYTVDIVSADGSSMPTYFQKGRYYVLGADGTRYNIRVTNPTSQRVEAVVSVDGLDVVDGEAGDLRKRGYVVPPHGQVLIEGWRTSLADVASFRFSSVSGSYAGKKGKARNVGVIAVAIFAEQPAPQIIVEEPPDYPYYYDEDDGDYGADVEVYLDRRAAAGPARGHGDAAKAKAPTATTRTEGASGGGGRVAQRRPASPPPMPAADATGASEAEAPSGAMGGAPAPRSIRPDVCCDDRPAPPKRERLGLGTEFGEKRYSAASYTKFVRASDKPIAVAELRYNDAGGLKALGILVEPLPDADEIMTRETADPFPGDRGFAHPPAGIR